MLWKLGGMVTKHGDSMNKEKGTEQLTLQELYDKVAQALKDSYPKENVSVEFDFGPRVGSFHSWRGDYSHASVSPEWEYSGPEMDAKKFLNALGEFIGSTQEGYKGGDFLMSGDTPIWVADYGNSGHTVICGVSRTRYDGIILHTMYKDYHGESIVHY